jgi:hypothetical protein
MDWGDELVAAWNTHTVEALTSMFAEKCLYTDMPHELSWEGHDGLRKMFDQTVAFHPDYRFTKGGGFSDGRNYALEWTVRGTTLGTMLAYRGVSLGTLDDQGLIIENRDYWNPKDIPGLASESP